MSGTGDADDDSGEDSTILSERLSQQSRQRHEGEDEHGQHTSTVRIHATLLHKQLRQIAAEDRDHRDDEIQDEDERGALF